MKSYIYILTIAIGLLGWSCDDYLDTAPDERQEIKKLTDVSELVANSYSEASYVFLEWMSDNATALSRNNQKEWMTQNFMWKPVLASESQDTPVYFWSQTYTAIAHANQALDAIDAVENTDGDLKKAIKGEALVSRAYSHFLLANIFCQHYDEATAASDLGIPYIAKPETALIVKYERGTLQETYNKIEKDLTEGIALLSDEYYVGSGKYHFNKAAAYAFASRLYLFKRDYANCIKYSNLLLGEGITNTVFVRDMEKVFTGTSGNAMADQFTNPNSTTNLLLVRKETLNVPRTYVGYRSNHAVMNQVFRINRLGSKDFRDSRWGWRDDKGPNKYAQRWRYTTATTGYPYYIHAELRSEEVILNRCEAYIMTNVDGATENLDKAMVDYNVMAASWYENFVPLTSQNIIDIYGAYNAENMMKFIIAERRKEFFVEAIRWFDIKRFKMSYTHETVTGETSTLEASDLRKAVQVPSGAIAKGIQANPR
ncbi:RagB/SusD family nutrient uptake outer membrane protein [Ancylomarina sp. DW003]|nr:RagB/SusD family nutrient uptake outer membrane protein [Ancylomarina sp. DW003]MDE5420729.1 RagB/SusD family nutrient uptake outer membrane protein [Ancylomarina sp. DW003]